MLLFHPTDRIQHTHPQESSSMLLTRDHVHRSRKSRGTEHRATGMPVVMRLTHTVVESRNRTPCKTRV